MTIPEHCAWRKTCERKPMLSPVLVFRAPVKCEPCPEVKSSMSMGYCLECSKVVTLEHLLLDEGFAMIQEGMRRAGRVPFDRSRTTLEWQSLELMVEMFERMEQSRRGH